MRVPVAVWQPCELLYTCCLLTYLLTREIKPRISESSPTASIITGWEGSRFDLLRTEHGAICAATLAAEILPTRDPRDHSTRVITAAVLGAFGNDDLCISQLTRSACGVRSGAVPIRTPPSRAGAVETAFMAMLLTPIGVHPVQTCSRLRASRPVLPHDFLNSAQISYTKKTQI